MKGARAVNPPGRSAALASHPTSKGSRWWVNIRTSY
jgi:hypothetical protein